MKNAFNEDDMSLEDDEMSVELYNMLAQICHDPALAVLRAVDRCRGLTAWQKLHRVYSYQTIARTIQALGEVTRPAKVTDVDLAEATIDGGRTF